LPQLDVDLQTVIQEWGRLPRNVQAIIGLLMASHR
jgi:hypothetical protein